MAANVVAVDRSDNFASFREIDPATTYHRLTDARSR
jgi:hypothetical protein